MTVHVDRMTTDVVAEPEAGAETRGETPVWEELQRMRAAAARLRAEGDRTRAAGFDD
ncbi:MAG TPA: hypothetical protein VFH27_16985 [Longimicrobiaceae bacterium]|nr:hypothetical protein [Longimicrobiaceae bacterium]